MSEMIPGTDLRLRDIVQVFDGPFGTAAVTQIKDGMVTLFRPYVETAEFSYTGGVIPYIGIEVFTRTMTAVPWLVYKREDVA